MKQSKKTGILCGMLATVSAGIFCLFHRKEKKKITEKEVRS